MRPDRLQDKERSARLSQKGKVSLCAFLDSGTTLEHSRSSEQRWGCASQKACTASDIPNLQSELIEKGTSHSNLQHRAVVRCVRFTDISKSFPEYMFFSSQPDLKMLQQHLEKDRHQD